MGERRAPRKPQTGAERARIRPMRFAYYEHLGADSKSTYRRSDAILRVQVPGIASAMPLAAGVEAALDTGEREAVQRACQALVDALNARLATPPTDVRVLERRPANAEGELQGLYEPDEVTGGRARITVWMRTAQRQQVVRYRTFLRTLVHELCHHFDYELYGLEETFHTQGFYARESGLMRELVGEAPKPVGPPMDTDAMEQKPYRGPPLDADAGE